jgi:molybdopterin-containing oxidoreductase family membrane subunit
MDATSKRIETDRVIAPGQTYGSLDDLITKPVLTPLLKTPLGWLLGFGLSAALLMLFMVTVYVLITTGMGIFGNNQPVAWAFPIINLVWWIGIGHAGTMISAILLLVRQDWRTSINRFAEAMTLFAVACAGLFPILHLGRPWLFYWLMPYPNTMDLWPQFRSPLAWDVFAITAYASVSALFWFIGLLPDLATLRDRAQRPIARLIYGALSLGWRGSAKHWQRYTRAYLLLAALAAPLVVSVHTTISFDFAVTQVPGWNNTIMPPYFVAGALFAGFAMVLILAIPLRKMFGFEGLITLKHLDNSAKVMLATGLFVAYGYLIELFIGWYSGTEFERFMVLNRLFGDYTWAFWALITFNVLAIQPLWFKSVRRTPWALFVIAILVSIGMWLERFVIISVSLSRDFMTSAWHNYQPTTWDFALFLGSIGLFLTLWFLFLRFLPAIASSEVKELVHHDATHHHAKEAKA